MTHDLGTARTQVLVVVVAYADRFETERIYRWLDDLIARAANVPALSVTGSVWDNRAHGLPLVSPRTKYLSSPEGNIGYGAAVNRVAFSNSFDRVLLLNSDIRLNSTLFNRVLEVQTTLEKDTIWAPVLLNADGSVQTSEGSLFLLTLRQEILSIFGFPPKGPRTKPKRFYVRGAVFSISSQLFSEASGFDETFFLYGEEADLCFRLAKASTVTDSSFQVVHEGSQGSKGKSWFALRHALRARALLQGRYNGLPARILTAAAGVVYFILLKAKRGLFDEDGKRASGS